MICGWCKCGLRQTADDGNGIWFTSGMPMPRLMMACGRSISSMARCAMTLIASTSSVSLAASKTLSRSCSYSHTSRSKKPRLGQQDSVLRGGSTRRI